VCGDTAVSVFVLSLSARWEWDHLFTDTTVCSIDSTWADSRSSCKLPVASVQPPSQIEAQLCDLGSRNESSDQEPVFDRFCEHVSPIGANMLVVHTAAPKLRVC